MLKLQIQMANSSFGTTWQTATHFCSLSCDNASHRPSYNDIFCKKGVDKVSRQVRRGSVRPTTHLNRLVQVPSDACGRDSGRKPKDSHQNVEVNWERFLHLASVSGSLVLERSIYLFTIFSIPCGVSLYTLKL